MKDSSKLHAGEWVQVATRKEILATLDKTGRLHALPFMPEMLDFCGHQFKVLKRAHKTCDPPNGLSGRRMASAVHLEGVRCSGESHGGCEAECLIFWKEAWLRRPDGSRVAGLESTSNAPRADHSGHCLEADVLAGARVSTGDQSPEESVYACQSTELASATEGLSWWDVRQYVEDYRSGNVQLSQMLASFFSSLYYELATAGVGLGAAMRWVYDAVQKARGGTPYPWRHGRIPPGVRTPSATLNLQPGELVRIKSYAEILATLDESGHNRGMWFDAELVPYCGGTHRVHKRVGRIVDEKTGRIRHLKNDCLVLEDVVCRACYATNRKFCPRAIFAYWREVWLERVPERLGDEVK